MRPLAIVTGASRGIGAAVARELLERDWDVVGAARSEALPELDSKNLVRLRVDLADTADLLRAFEEELPQRCRLDGRRRVGLVNNAARLDLEPIPTASHTHLCQAMALNVATPTWLMGHVARHAPEAALRIINISSGAASNPYPGWAAYCASKAALDMASQVLAVEAEEVASLASRDIAVVAFSPGVVATDMQRELRAATDEMFPRRARFVELHEKRELLPPEAPATKIVELLESDPSSTFTRLRFQP